MMGGAVGSDQSGSVNSQNYRKLLQGYVVNNLIIAALGESRIEGTYRQ